MNKLYPNPRNSLYTLDRNLHLIRMAETAALKTSKVGLKGVAFVSGWGEIEQPSSCFIWIMKW